MNLISVGATSNPAQALPYDQLSQPCQPKLRGTHDCLDSLPAYSYHLALQSNSSEQLCVELGDWEGDNTVVLEWDGLQTQLSLSGKAGVAQFLEPSQRQGRSSVLVLYSDQQIMPELIQGDCAVSRELGQVTLASWPEPGNGAGSLAQGLEEE